MLGYTKEQQTARSKKRKPSKVSKTELKKRVLFLIDKRVCQVCEESEELDYPHHSLFGLGKKDDRTMINICVDCHRHIHTKGFPLHGKDRAETVAIGWLNNKEYINEN